MLFDEFTRFNQFKAEQTVLDPGAGQEPSGDTGDDGDVSDDVSTQDGPETQQQTEPESQRGTQQRREGQPRPGAERRFRDERDAERRRNQELQQQLEQTRREMGETRKAAEAFDRMKKAFSGDDQKPADPFASMPDPALDVEGHRTWMREQLERVKTEAKAEAIAEAKQGMSADSSAQIRTERNNELEQQFTTARGLKYNPATRSYETLPGHEADGWTGGKWSEFTQFIADQKLPAHGRHGEFTQQDLDNYEMLYDRQGVLDRARREGSTRAVDHLTGRPKPAARQQGSSQGSVPPGETLDEQVSYAANRILGLRKQDDVNAYVTSLPKEVRAELQKQADDFFLDEDA